jgi:hypothetical protein
MERFKNSQIEFAAQVSGSRNSRASANVKYAEGVMVFTMQKGGPCTRHQLVDNSLSLLNCRRALLSVATSCIMQP